MLAIVPIGHEIVSVVEIHFVHERLPKNCTFLDLEFNETFSFGLNIMRLRGRSRSYDSILLVIDYEYIVNFATKFSTIFFSLINKNSA